MIETTDKNLKKLLKDMKLTAYGLATEMKTHRSVVCLYLQGKRKPSLTNCKKIIEIAKRFGVKIDLNYLRPDLGINFTD